MSFPDYNKNLYGITKRKIQKPIDEVLDEQILKINHQPHVTIDTRFGIVEAIENMVEIFSPCR